MDPKWNTSTLSSNGVSIYYWRWLCNLRVADVAGPVNFTPTTLLSPSLEQPSSSCRKAAVLISPRRACWRIPACSTQYSTKRRRPATRSLGHFYANEKQTTAWIQFNDRRHSNCPFPAYRAPRSQGECDSKAARLSQEQSSQQRLHTRLIKTNEAGRWLRVLSHSLSRSAESRNNEFSRAPN